MRLHVQSCSFSILSTKHVGDASLRIHRSSPHGVIENAPRPRTFFIDAVDKEHMVAKNETTTYCLCLVGIIVLIALVYMLCRMNGGGGSKTPPGGSYSSCGSANGRMAQRSVQHPIHVPSQASQPSPLAARRPTSMVDDVEMSGVDVAPIWKQGPSAVSAGCTTMGEDTNHFAPKSGTLAGSRKGANTSANQMSQSGRSDHVAKASNVGLKTVPWMADLEITLDPNACVSFNDTDTRQMAISNIMRMA